MNIILRTEIILTDFIIWWNFTLKMLLSYVHENKSELDSFPENIENFVCSRLIICHKIFHWKWENANPLFRSWNIFHVKAHLINVESQRRRIFFFSREFTEALMYFENDFFSKICHFTQMNRLNPSWTCCIRLISTSHSRKQISGTNTLLVLTLIIQNINSCWFINVCNSRDFFRVYKAALLLCFSCTCLLWQKACHLGKTESKRHKWDEIFNEWNVFLWDFSFEGFLDASSFSIMF